MTTAATATKPAVVEGRRLTPKAMATRARIIEHATEVFATVGYGAATIRDIAARAGVSSGAIYATFRGKADLLAETVRASIEADLEAIPERVLAEPLPRIDAHQFALADDPRRERLRRLLLEAATAARTEPEVQAALGAILRARLGVWSQAHLDWQAQGHADPALDMHALTAVLVSIDLGIGVLTALGVAAPDAREVAAVVERLLAAVGARATMA